MPEWHHQKINRPTPAKSPPCPEHEGSGTPQGGDTADSVSPHGGLSEPSTWERKGRERDRDKGRGVSEADAPEATKALALVESRPDVDRLCEHLANRIEGNGAKRPTITKTWHDSARLMLDRDERTEQEVHGAIDWCQNDEFWRANILSMPKLREKYDQLRMQAQRHNGSSRYQKETDDVFARAARHMGIEGA